MTPALSFAQQLLSSQNTRSTSIPVRKSVGSRTLNSNSFIIATSSLNEQSMEESSRCFVGCHCQGCMKKSRRQLYSECCRIQSNHSRLPTFERYEGCTGVSDTTLHCNEMHSTHSRAKRTGPDDTRDPIRSHDLLVAGTKCSTRAPAPRNKPEIPPRLYACCKQSTIPLY